MWHSTMQVVDPDRVLRFRPQRAGRAISYADAIRYWREDQTFRSYFGSLLADAPFRAYRWEVPPVDRRSASRDFEFVLVDTPGLDRVPDEQAFADRFVGGNDTVISFPNLGNDATVVVPQKLGSTSAYSHLAAFVRRAPDVQQHALWQMVERTVALRLSDTRRWLSTAGLGVAWLHVRLDTRPKYYSHRPYARP